MVRPTVLKDVALHSEGWPWHGASELLHGEREATCYRDQLNRSFVQCLVDAACCTGVWPCKLMSQSPRQVHYTLLLLLLLLLLCLFLLLLLLFMLWVFCCCHCCCCLRCCRYVSPYFFGVGQSQIDHRVRRLGPYRKIRIYPRPRPSGQPRTVISRERFKPGMYVTTSRHCNCSNFADLLLHLCLRCLRLYEKGLLSDTFARDA
jgi:hypothetical protein